MGSKRPVSPGGTKLPMERARSRDAAPISWYPEQVPLPTPVSPRRRGSPESQPSQPVLHGALVGHIQGLWADVCGGLAPGLQAALDVRDPDGGYGLGAIGTPPGFVTLTQGRRVGSGADKAQPGAPRAQEGCPPAWSGPMSVLGHAQAYLGCRSRAGTRQGGCPGCGQRECAMAGGGNREPREAWGPPPTDIRQVPGVRWGSQQDEARSQAAWDNDQARVWTPSSPSRDPTAVTGGRILRADTLGAPLWAPGSPNLYCFICKMGMRAGLS